MVCHRPAVADSVMGTGGVVLVVGKQGVAIICKGVRLRARLGKFGSLDEIAKL